VAQEHARGRDGGAFGGAFDAHPETLFDLFPRQGPGAQLDEPVAIDGHNGGFNAALARSAIEHGDAASETFPHLRRGGGRELARGVGGGCCQRPVGGAQQVQGQGMIGDTQGDGIKPGRGDVGQAVALPEGQNDAQRTGPEALRKAAGQRRKHSKALGHGEVGAMDDQRIEARAALGLVDGEHGISIGGVGAQAIDRLGGKSAKLARAQQRGSIFDGHGERL
jgi:hypothetical protein